MRNVFGGFVLVLFGVLLLLDNMGIADFGDMVRSYWPLLLIVWGASILLRKKRPHPYQQQYEQPAAPPSDYSFVMDGDIINQSEVFGDTHIVVTSQNFMGGSVSTVFGDCNINLSKAVFGQGEFTLRIHTVFGDSRLILPNDAVVSLSANSTFGDMVVRDQHKGGFSSYINFTTPGYDTATNKLKISISKVFGDLVVTA